MPVFVVASIIWAGRVVAHKNVMENCAVYLNTCFGITLLGVFVFALINDTLSQLTPKAIVNATIRYNEKIFSTSDNRS